MCEIQGYELYKVPPRWLFLKIETSDGLVGWGEPIVEGRADTVSSAVEELMEDFLVGKNPFEIEEHWQLLYRGGYYRGGPILMSAIGGIDQALWDIKGKRYNAPVYELLGGKVRDRIRVYQKISTETISELETIAREAVDDGYTAIKLYPAAHTRYIESPAEIDKICERVQVVRDAVGPDVDLAVDLHGRISVSMVGKLCSRLDEYDLLFVEEPVRPERMLTADKSTWSFKAPLAIGERLYTRWDFRSHFDQVPVDIVQPDPTHAGGISEVRKIADLADAHGIDLAINCSVGPIAAASCLQLSAYASNTVIQPTPENQYIDNYTRSSGIFDQENGYVNVSSSPGLGIDIDEEAVQEQAGNVSDWKNPVWRHDDTSLAEW